MHSPKMAFFKVYLILALIYFSESYISDIKLQCHKYDFNKNFNISADRNVVVIYNSALCKRCLQKLFAFKALQHRFEAADFKELRFIMLTTELSKSDQFGELQNKTGNITLISLQDMNNDIFVPGSIYIFDKCGRLTYELVPPFSEIQNQVVKAAILSTWYDSLCGNCEFEKDDSVYFEDNYDFDDSPDVTTEVGAIRMENIEIVNPEETYNDTDESIIPQKNDSNYIIPLKIVLPMEHIHKEGNNTYIKFNFIELNSNNSNSHEHLRNDNIEVLFGKTASTERNSTLEIEVNNDFHSEVVSDDGSVFKITKTYFAASDKNESDISQGEYAEVENVKNAISITPPKALASNNGTKMEISSLFNALHPWISFRLLNRY